MLVWRLAKSGYATLDGEGARLFGGRWNRPGRPVVYTAESLSLAALELLVHVDPATLPDDLVEMTIELPDDLPTEAIEADRLPRGWAEVPAPSELQALGAAWLERGAAAALRVPSAVVPGEWNRLLDPHHRDFLRVRVVDQRPFALDPRLRRR